MIKATFYRQKDGNLSGFEIKGHSGYSEQGQDIICASVSSAAYMTANTVTDVIFGKADIAVDEGYMSFILKDKIESSQVILEGFLLHVKALATDYEDFVLCKETTVTE